jgi:hypothetical protein
MTRIILFLILTVAVYSNVEKGEISFLQGRAFIQRGVRIIPAKIKDPVNAGDTISVEEGSQASINLYNTGLIKITEKSKFEIPLKEENNERTSSVSLFFGSLWTKAKKLVKGESFEIKTPTATAGVRGTEFGVDFDPSSNTMETAVEEGHVVATMNDGTEVDLFAGMVVSANNQGYEAKHDPVRVQQRSTKAAAVADNNTKEAKEAAQKKAAEKAAQLKKMEAEQAKEKAAKEKAAKEKAAKEKAEKEAKEKAAKEKAAKEAKEKAAKEKAEKEAKEKAAKEKTEKEAKEKAAKEKAAKETKEKAAAEAKAKAEAAKEKAEKAAAEAKAKAEVAKEKAEKAAAEAKEKADSEVKKDPEAKKESEEKKSEAAAPPAAEENSESALEKLQELDRQKENIEVQGAIDEMLHNLDRFGTANEQITKLRERLMELMLDTTLSSEEKKTQIAQIESQIASYEAELASLEQQQQFQEIQKQKMEGNIQTALKNIPEGSNYDTYRNQLTQLLSDTSLTLAEKQSKLDDISQQVVIAQEVANNQSLAEIRAIETARNDRIQQLTTISTKISQIQNSTLSNQEKLAQIEALKAQSDTLLNNAQQLDPTEIARLKALSYEADKLAKQETALNNLIALYGGLGDDAINTLEELIRQEELNNIQDEQERARVARINELISIRTARAQELQDIITKLNAIKSDSTLSTDEKSAQAKSLKEQADSIIAQAEQLDQAEVEELQTLSATMTQIEQGAMESLFSFLDTINAINVGGETIPIDIIVTTSRQKLTKDGKLEIPINYKGKKYIVDVDQKYLRDHSKVQQIIEQELALRLQEEVRLEQEKRLLVELRELRNRREREKRESDYVPATTIRDGNGLIINVVR